MNPTTRLRLTSRSAALANVARVAGYFIREEAITLGLALLLALALFAPGDVDLFGVLP